MTDRLKFSLAGAWTLLFLVLLFAKARDTSFSASVVDLLPGDDIEVQILRELVENEQGRQIIVKLSGEEAPVDSTTVQVFIDVLEQSPAIEQSWIAGNKALDQAGATIFQNRYKWLLPEWLDRNFPDWRHDSSITQTDIANRIVENLDKSLLSPEGFALTETIPKDPFLLASFLYEEEGLLPDSSTRGDVYLWLQQAASPFLEEGQTPVFEALESAYSAVRKLQPGIQMEYSGVSVFASASKSGIKGEIQRLNILGGIFVLLVSILAIQQFLAILRVGIVVIISLLTAATAVITVFASVHIIALVIGSILAGIAVDYAFHLILGEEYGLPKKSVTKAVITGSISSALGFIVLVWAPLPFLQQVGVFVGAGLIAALLISLLLRPPTPVRSLSSRWQIRPFSLSRWTGPVCLLIIVPGLFHMEWRDSINDLEYPLPELKQKEERLRLESSVLESRKAYLAYGKDATEARRTLSGIEASVPEKLIHAGKWIPGFEDSFSAQRFFSGFPDFESSLRNALDQNEYFPDAFSDFFTDWEKHCQRPVTQENYESDIIEFAKSLPGPMRNIIHCGNALSWFMVMVPKDISLAPGKGLIELDQATMLSQSFSNYREAITIFAGICLLGILISIVLVYGIKDGFLSIGIPFTALVIAFSIATIFHSGLGLFHLVGGLLAFCIALDYAIFAVQTHRAKCALPASVTISLITTLGVFGILSTSRIPGVHQFALTVLFGIGFAAILIVCGWPHLKRHGGQENLLFASLPHGREALMILRTLRIEGATIEMECRPNAYQEVPGESLIEAMAQSAAVLLASSADSESKGRMGLLVLIQKCEISKPVLEAGGTCVAKVEAMSDLKEGLLVFKGTCHGESGSELISGLFSIFIPPQGKDGEIS